MSATELPTLLRRTLALTLAAGGIHTAGAAGSASPVVTEADIERARRDQPTISDQDIEAARRKHSPPSALPPPPASLRVDALPQPVTRTTVDLEALARGYASQADAMQGAEGLARGPGLFVFISLSMPRPALQSLIDQAARARASVILRGFVNGSLRETVARVQPLIGERQVAVQIDPQAFDRFAITRVPSFVLVRDATRPIACAAGTCPPPEGFLRVAGDVSLDYALEHMQRAAPQFRAEASGFLVRLAR